MFVYIRADLAYNHRTDLQHDDIESVWVKILLPKSKPILVGICYRPPKQSAFVSQLKECCLNNDHFEGQEVIMLGDFNANYQNPMHTVVKALKQFCHLFDLDQR